MTNTLLLRLAGPMQAWGVQSRFNQRETLSEPSKSGVIGLLCAALGKPREERPEHAERWPTIEQLAALKMGVRVDRFGSMLMDYHTVKDILPADVDLENLPALNHHPDKFNTNVTDRYYLSDAWFTVALEGDLAILEPLYGALENPHRPLTLGRKAFPLSAPVYVQNGLTENLLLDVLPGFEDPYWKQVLPEAKRPTPNRLLLEEEVTIENWIHVASPMRPDQPVSFQSRRFIPRTVYVYVPKQDKSES